MNRAFKFRVKVLIFFSVTRYRYCQFFVIFDSLPAKVDYMKIKRLLLLLCAAWAGSLNACNEDSWCNEEEDEWIECPRQQGPMPPYPYQEEGIVFQNHSAGVTLSGTFTYPFSNESLPAVILITDTIPANPTEEFCSHKTLLFLADHLTRQGIAVLQFEKRGCISSTGNFSSATSTDLVADVLAGIDYLKSRKEVDAKRIGLVGHSEGGLTASMVASQTKDIAFLVLMASPGVTGKEICVAQTVALFQEGNEVSEAELNYVREFADRMYSIVINEPDNEAAAKQLCSFLNQQMAHVTDESEWNTEMSRQIVKGLCSPWCRYFLSCDPTLFFQKINVPVLALNGEKDMQIPADPNLTAIDRALNEAGNKNYTAVVLPNINHFFQTCGTGSFDEEEETRKTISPSVSDLISSWIIKICSPSDSK
jgi:pimeloyl-ACP methyl ester carboxylesterase